MKEGKQKNKRPLKSNPTRKVSKARAMIDKQERIKYTLEDYEHVDSLIEQYQSGENQDEVLDELIKLFKPYLNKFLIS